MHRTLLVELTPLVMTTVCAVGGEKTVTLAVDNMTCIACPYIVKQSLVGVPGVIRAEVSSKKERPSCPSTTHRRTSPP